MAQHCNIPARVVVTTGRAHMPSQPLPFEYIPNRKSAIAINLLSLSLLLIPFSLFSTISRYLPRVYANRSPFFFHDCCPTAHPTTSTAEPLPTTSLSHPSDKLLACVAKCLQYHTAQPSFPSTHVNANKVTANSNGTNPHPPISTSVDPPWLYATSVHYATHVHRGFNHQHTLIFKPDYVHLCYTAANVPGFHQGWRHAEVPNWVRLWKQYDLQQVPRWAERHFISVDWVWAHHLPSDLSLPLSRGDIYHRQFTHLRYSLLQPSHTGSKPTDR